MVIVDWFSKYANFVPVPKTLLAVIATELLYKQVVKYFGLLEDIINDRDLWFIGRF